MVMLPALSPRRRRAERFADALDGRPVGDDPQLAGLVQLADALRRVPAGPSPDFTDQLRRRLVAVASLPLDDARPVAERRAIRAPVRRVRLATGAVAAVTLLTAVSVGASSSLPGQALYGLKRAAEGAQLAVAGSDYQRGVRELQFADTRLHEVADLTGRPDVVSSGPAADFRPAAAVTVLASGETPAAASTAAEDAAPEIVGALSDMRTETGKGARYLARGYQQHHNATALTTLHAFTVRQYDGLRALLPALPSAAVPAARTSLAQLVSIDRIVVPVLKADRLCAAGCAPAVPATPLPGGATVLPGVGGAPASDGAGAPGGGVSVVPSPGASSGTQGGSSGGGAGGQGGASSAPGDPLGGLLGGSGSSSGSGSGGPLPVPLPTTSLPLPLPTGSLPVPPLPTASLPVPPLPTSSLPLPLPGGGSSSGQPSSQPTPGVTVCASPLVLVGGVCVTVPIPPLLP